MASVTMVECAVRYYKKDAREVVKNVISNLVPNYGLSVGKVTFKYSLPHGGRYIIHHFNVKVTGSRMYLEMFLNKTRRQVWLGDIKN